MNRKGEARGERTPRPVPAALAAASIRSSDGEQVPVASLWAVRPVVLAFVRHFG